MDCFVSPTPSNHSLQKYALQKLSQETKNLKLCAIHTKQSFPSGRASSNVIQHQCRQSPELVHKQMPQWGESAMSTPC